jgi:catechol 2,3-dioxygenase-like lactoylglutathione lyase family enzyme
MPSFTGVLYVGLSVRDVRRSADWYRDLLDMETERENFDSSSWPSDWDEVLLRHPESGLLIGLLQHKQNPGDPFSEFRTGLDHLELEVGSLEELREWERRLNERGILHSGIQQAHILTFRDPDNIQLEFFLRAPEETLASGALDTDVAAEA